MKEEKVVVNEEKKKELSDRRKHKFKKYAEKYKTHERLMIAASTRKTIRFIERNISNLPNKNIVLKNKIIESCYSILENVYRANIVDVSPDSIIIELTGNNSKVEAFINLLDGFEILELVRTGITGLTRGSDIQ